jgi:predicted CoA-binding protein
MNDLAAIDGFLAGHRIALVGVSSRPEDFSRLMFHELATRGYDVVPVRPNLDSVDGARAYARLQDVPGRLDGALLMTPPEVTAAVVRDCEAAHVPRVWMHRGVGGGAVNREAVAWCREHNIEVVAGECPLMFLPGGKSFHQTHAAWRQLVGSYPRSEANRHPRFGALIAHGVAGWAICAAAMAVFLNTLPLTPALWLHLLVVPLVFYVTARVYFVRSGAASPLLTAALFTAIAALMDLVIVVGVIQHSTAMFASFVGTWLPFLAIFAATLTAGAATLHRR